MEEILINFLFSLKWLWIVVLFLIWNIVNRSIKIHAAKVDIKRQTMIKTTDYDEEKIIKHLDYIINEALDEYIIFHINPNNVFYINSKKEKEIVDYLVDKVPERISPIEMQMLSMVYNSSYISEFLGRHIYMMVTQYVLEFNVNNSKDTDEEKKPQKLAQE